ncbi:hypothetical protein AKJ58_00140 [candidate division MSBL1 archaeon SCGC-AAA385D11]|uniref:Uncharacterized protein n=1 Tax=candidate division MSBL1 archaeon SCGC-AAA385D11 TaxID=1698286 RepID=A0A133VPM2_9EURY|nr:hypothetical protein AKJ58_00140 [candidate division MSBL1 archaeon SCGC-AAA385D11]
MKFWEDERVRKIRRVIGLVFILISLWIFTFSYLPTRYEGKMVVNNPEGTNKSQIIIHFVPDTVVAYRKVSGCPLTEMEGFASQGGNEFWIHSYIPYNEIIEACKHETCHLHQEYRGEYTPRTFRADQKECFEAEENSTKYEYCRDVADRVLSHAFSFYFQKIKNRTMEVIF